MDYPKKKLLLNRIFNIFVKFIIWSDYNDFTNAFKIYKSDTLKKLQPFVSDNFNIFLEIPLKLIFHKYKYKIIPINWSNRKIGKAKFKINELGSKYLYTLYYLIKKKIFKN
jgi:dolichol-phosphate mannosyltransferase